MKGHYNSFNLLTEVENKCISQKRPYSQSQTQNTIMNASTKNNIKRIIKENDIKIMLLYYTQ